MHIYDEFSGGGKHHEALLKREMSSESDNN